ncbi:hypothetical protein HPB52_024203 [Rhipicephalus sanguineus]|uniref:Uncharacterized protein n=1 Tax=Rhipicephalus sanguineus TaxID=34632 RepID=A0A9D4YRE9_RHISA|nr:hypothetical protein HPB52_024203 [Rhipicephalus sanguineus]
MRVSASGSSGKRGTTSGVAVRRLKCAYTTELTSVENYTKGESTEESCGPPPFKDLRDDFVHMKDETKRQMVFTGSGHALAKTITVEDCWEPKSPEFDRLKIVREIPTIHILLSKDPVDATQLGYQAPGCTDGSWSTEQKPLKSRKKQFPKRTPRRQKTQQTAEQ